MKTLKEYFEEAFNLVAAASGDHRGWEISVFLASLESNGYCIVRSPASATHKKRGSEYDVLGGAEIQASSPINEGDVVTVYRCKDDGKLWARPVAEFFDGRFEIAARPKIED